MEKMGRIALLYDIYGALLTEKQARVLAMFYEEDLSLGEIAEILAVSRQAVYDMIKRSEELLEKYEAKMHILAKETQMRTLLADAITVGNWGLVAEALEKLNQ